MVVKIQCQIIEMLIICRFIRSAMTMSELHDLAKKIHRRHVRRAWILALLIIGFLVCVLPNLPPSTSLGWSGTVCLILVLTLLGRFMVMFCARKLETDCRAFAVKCPKCGMALLSLRPDMLSVLSKGLCPSCKCDLKQEFI